MIEQIGSKTTVISPGFRRDKEQCLHFRERYSPVWEFRKFSLFQIAQHEEIHRHIDAALLQFSNQKIQPIQPFPIRFRRNSATAIRQLPIELMQSNQIVAALCNMFRHLHQQRFRRKKRIQTDVHAVKPAGDPRAAGEFQIFTFCMYETVSAGEGRSGRPGPARNPAGPEGAELIAPPVLRATGRADREPCNRRRHRSADNRGRPSRNSPARRGR